MDRLPSESRQARRLCYLGNGIVVEQGQTPINSDKSRAGEVNEGGSALFPPLPSVEIPVHHGKTLSARAPKGTGEAPVPPSRSSSQPARPLRSPRRCDPAFAPIIIGNLGLVELRPPKADRRGACATLGTSVAKIGVLCN